MDESTATAKAPVKSYEEQVLEYVEQYGAYGLMHVLYDWIKAYPQASFVPFDEKRWHPRRFAKSLKTLEDALRISERMVESTGNSLNYFFYGNEMLAENALTSSIFLGVGIVFYRQTDAGRLIKNERGQIQPIQTPDGYPVVGRVVSGSDAEALGFRVGDVVQAINGVSTKRKPLTWLVHRLSGKEGDEVAIRRRGRKVRDFCRQQSISVGVTHKQLGETGYIRINTFFDSEVPVNVGKAMRALDACPNLIIDLRGTPGGLVFVCAQTMSLFLDQGQVLTTEFVHDDKVLRSDYVLTPECLEERGPGGKITKRDRQPNLSGDKKIVILIDGNTRSAPEGFTQVMLDYGRATTVGMRSYGKGIVQGHRQISGIAELDMAIGKWFSPKGIWIGDGGHYVTSGIVPTHEQELSPGSLFAGPDDSQLARALAVLDV
jgi:C-terminal processing protease CtpA/Prc